MNVIWVRKNFSGVDVQESHRYIISLIRQPADNRLNCRIGNVHKKFLLHKSFKDVIIYIKKYINIMENTTIYQEKNAFSLV